MSFIDDLKAGVDALLHPVDTVTKASAATVAALKQKAQAWAKEVVALYNMKVPASMEAEKRALLSRANTIRKMVEAVFGNMAEFKNIQLSGAPLIAVTATAITAIAAAMTYWVTDFGKFKLEVTRQIEANKHVQQLVSQGVPLKDAIASTAKDETKSWFERIIGDPQKVILPAIGLSIGGYLVYKYFINKR